MSTESERKVVDAFISMLLMPWNIMLRGVVLSFSWGWFIAEPFGAPVIGVAHACGLSLLYTVATINAARADDEEKSTTEKVLASLAKHAIALFIAWLIHLFM